MTPNHTRPICRGFTIPELLVAMAVSLGIMVILTEAFQVGLDFSRYARSTGEMMTQLQGASIILARDMQADHFLPDDTKPNRGLKLSDQRLDLQNQAGTSWNPPKGGFFRIESPQPTIYRDEVDREGHYMHTAANHRLHFTAILPGGVEQNLFGTVVNNAAYSSRAAEIAYFLVDSGERTSPGPNGRVLYHLIRRQRLAALDTTDRMLLDPAATDPDVIAGNGSTQAYTLADLTDPTRRLTSYTQIAPGSANGRHGEDIVLSRVLSFEVLADWTPNQNNVAGSNQGPWAFKTTTGVLDNTDFPFDYLRPTGQGALANQHVFDTWYAHSNWGNNPAPLLIRVNTIQVRVRLFDPRMKNGRQVTWTFNM